tara:strand:+ start:1409 stop:1909 length:501 start_codon:yes stop_codon:yes gene_type:complete
MTFEYTPQPSVTQEALMIVFDLDGTLANCEARVNKHLLDADGNKREKPDWDAFFLDCSYDLPIIPTLAVLEAMHESGHQVWIWTGRSDIAKEQTEEWLLMHGVSPDIIFNRLKMRQADDRRNDDEVKPVWIEECGMPDIVFEDRNRVVKAWREKGILTYHVADADF